MNIDILGVILARGGSQRLPQKNKKILAGKPLLQWTIEAAIDSGVIDMLVLSSDDQEMLSLSEKLNVHGSFRPPELAQNDSSSIDVIFHLLDELEQQSVFPKKIMLLQPTSPLRSSLDISDAVKKMNETGANSVISVCETEHSPLWSNHLPKDGKMDDFLEKNLFNKRSQELGRFYRLNGAIYLASTHALRVHNSFFMDNSQSLIMPIERSIDIDNQYDFDIAEFLINKQMHRHNQ